MKRNGQKIAAVVWVNEAMGKENAADDWSRVVLAAGESLSVNDDVKTLFSVECPQSRFGKWVERVRRYWRARSRPAGGGRRDVK